MVTPTNSRTVLLAPSQPRTRRPANVWAVSSSSRRASTTIGVAVNGS